MCQGVSRALSNSIQTHEVGLARIRRTVSFSPGRLERSMEMSRDKVRSILNRDSWYANLPDSLQEQLLDIGVPRQFEMGRPLFRRGDATCGVYCVLDGQLAVLATSKHGDEAIQINLKPGQWFGEVGLLACAKKGMPCTRPARGDRPTARNSSDEFAAAQQQFRASRRPSRCASTKRE